MTQKRVRLSAEVRQEQILETATRLFIEQGFSHVQMGDIAEQLGVSRPNIYTYFASTEAVFTALLERHTAALLADLKRTHAANPLMTVAETFDIILQHPNLVLLLRSAGAPMLRTQRREMLRAMNDHMEGVWDSHIPPEQRKAYEQLIVMQHNLFMDTAYEVLSEPENYDLDLVKAQLHEMLFAAYGSVLPQLHEAWKQQVPTTAQGG